MVDEGKKKTLSVFFDTEFTKFRSANDEPKLISIGLVAEDGREFYAELLDTWGISDCSQFVISVVLELLDNKEFIKEADLAVKLKAAPYQKPFHYIESFVGINPEGVPMREVAQHRRQVSNRRDQMPGNFRENPGRGAQGLGYLCCTQPR